MQIGNPADLSCRAVLCGTLRALRVQIGNPADLSCRAILPDTLRAALAVQTGCPAGLHGTNLPGANLDVRSTV
ncbi:hypothetical protein [Methylocaldum gracile]|uniref:hypothetical protein n=1 Tax=unclassified Methylocaldum TaxID=2622260 RepID=UPI00105B699E